jgi:hypothetical protein
MVRSSAKTASSVKVSKERKETLTKLLDLDSKAMVKATVHEFLYDFLVFTAELMMNTEVIELVGERHKRDAKRDCQRWASQQGSGLLLGQRHPLEGSVIAKLLPGAKSKRHVKRSHTGNFLIA